MSIVKPTDQHVEIADVTIERYVRHYHIGLEDSDDMARDIAYVIANAEARGKERAIANELHVTVERQRAATELADAFMTLLFARATFREQTSDLLHEFPQEHRPSDAVQEGDTGDWFQRWREKDAPVQAAEQAFDAAVAVYRAQWHTDAQMAAAGAARLPGLGE